MVNTQTPKEPMNKNLHDEIKGIRMAMERLKLAYDYIPDEHLLYLADAIDKIKILVERLENGAE